MGSLHHPVAVSLLRPGAFGESFLRQLLLRALPRLLPFWSKRASDCCAEEGALLELSGCPQRPRNPKPRGDRPCPSDVAASPGGRRKQKLAGSDPESCHRARHLGLLGVASRNSRWQDSHFVDANLPLSTSPERSGEESGPAGAWHQKFRAESSRFRPVLPAHLVHWRGWPRSGHSPLGRRADRDCGF